MIYRKPGYKDFRASTPALEAELIAAYEAAQAAIIPEEEKIKVTTIFSPRQYKKYEKINRQLDVCGEIFTKKFKAGVRSDRLNKFFIRFRNFVRGQHKIFLRRYDTGLVQTLQNDFLAKFENKVKKHTSPWYRGRKLFTKFADEALLAIAKSNKKKKFLYFNPETKFFITRYFSMAYGSKSYYKKLAETRIALKRNR